MNRPVKTEHIPFFFTAPAPCPYLDGFMERKVFTKLELAEVSNLNDTLTHAGFRRSQSILYRPACEACSACKSARVCVDQFEPSRSQNRTLKRNQNLIKTIKPAEATPEQYALLMRYLDTRHGDGDMVSMDFFDFTGMIEHGAEASHVVEYRTLPGDLVACVLVDRLKDGYSLVYSFFDPSQSSRSLGGYIILDHIKQAQQLNMEFVYLGYWVRESKKMNYKAQFRPVEILEPTGWRKLSDLDIEPSR